MKEGIPYNINGHVWVQLYDEGKRIFYEYYNHDDKTQEEVLRIFHIQEDGWIKLQMHQFMKIFGPSMINGIKLPICGNIRIIVDPIT